MTAPTLVRTCGRCKSPAVGECVICDRRGCRKDYDEETQTCRIPCGQLDDETHAERMRSYFEDFPFVTVFESLGRKEFRRYQHRGEAEAQMVEGVSFVEFDPYGLKYGEWRV